MLILRLWNYMRGYVIIRVEGLYLEKFINNCIEKDIYLWEIKRINYTTLEACISIKGFKELRKISRKVGCKVYLSRKNGYPFWAHKIKKRKMLLIGAFFSFILLIFASSFIYNVEVIGNEQLEEEVIVDYLKEVGLKPGVNKRRLDIRQLENQLMIEFNELAWVGIELRGIYAKIEVVEKIVPPPKVDRNTPADVIATKHGVIEEVIAKNGDAVVKKGDIVSEGDMLITGIVSREQLAKPLYVHAYGEVYAKTYYEANKSMSLVEIKNYRTGEAFSRKTLRFRKLQMGFGGNDIPFSDYEIEKENKKLSLWRNVSLPVEIIVETYYEIIEIEETIDVVKAKEQLHQEAVLELMEQIPLEGEIVDTNVIFNVEGNTLRGTVIIEVIEDIGDQKEIIIEED